MAAESNTVYGVIRDAMFDAGYLEEGQNPNSEQLATNMRRLSDIINYYQTKGLKLYFLQEVSVPLITGQGAYTLGPTGDVVMRMPKRILQAFVINAQGIQRPLVALSWEEWMRLSQVTGNNSTISSYFVDKQATYLRVHFWNPPDATEAANTVTLLTQTAAPEVFTLTQDTGFPQEWRLALRWGLADDISTGQPEAIMNRCSINAKIYFEALENWDVEDVSTQWTIDPRSDYSTRGFS